MVQERSAGLAPKSRAQSGQGYIHHRSIDEGYARSEDAGGKRGPSMWGWRKGSADAAIPVSQGPGTALVITNRFRQIPSWQPSH